MALGFKKKKRVNPNEFENESKSLKLGDIAGGRVISDFLARQAGLVILILFMIFFYISNRYECQQKLVDIEKLQKELVDVKYDALTHSAELMGGSKQSQVKELVAEQGVELEESQIPPFQLNEIEGENGDE